MVNVLALAHGHMALDLELAGISVERVTEPKAAEERLLQLLESNEARVVVVLDTFRDTFSEWFHERLRRHKGLPLVVFCPVFEEEVSNVDAYITAVLKPAIGYEIRLE